MAKTPKRKAAPAPWLASAIERRALAELLPYARNARTHSAEQVAQIAESVLRFGWTIPILVDAEGVIVAGHGRALAAETLGLSEVPVIVVPEGWSEDDRRAYTIADNQIALNSGWDADLLKIELGELEGAGFEAATLGFSAVDLNGLFGAAESETDPAAEWRGMPEFDQRDKTAFRSIQVHFKDQAAVDAYAKLIGQTITDKTRFVWYPEAEIETYADKRYAAAGDES